MNVIEQKPQFGVNYDVGFDAFTSYKKDFIAAGIAWFERWDALPGVPPVCHALKIIGEDRTIEAFFGGIKYGKLSDYLNNPECALLVRKPIMWTPDMGARMTVEAEKHVGEKYNYLLIIMMALGHSYLGKGLDKLSNDKFSRWLERIADSKNTEICSQLVAKVNNTVEELKEKSVLKLPPYDITPLLLISDPVIYEPGIIELIP